MWQTILAGPYAEPISLVEAKLQTRQGTDVSAEDSLFVSLTTTARDLVESDTNRVLLWQRRSLQLDYWPCRIRIFACPVRAVDSIQYLDRAGVQRTLATSVYRVRTDKAPAEIVLADGQQWPDTADESGAVTVTFQSGYAVPFTANAEADTITFTEYEPTDGQTWRLSNSGGTLPGGLATDRRYFVRNASGSTCQLSLTEDGAAVNITDQGTGTHFLGVVPGWAMQSMRLLIARLHSDREGTRASAQCDEAYRQLLRPGMYTFL